MFSNLTDNPSSTHCLFLQNTLPEIWTGKWLVLNWGARFRHLGRSPSIWENSKNSHDLAIFVQKSGWPQDHLSILNFHQGHISQFIFSFLVHLIRCDRNGCIISSSVYGIHCSVQIIQSSLKRVLSVPPQVDHDEKKLRRNLIRKIVLSHKQPV